VSLVALPKSRTRGDGGAVVDKKEVRGQERKKLKGCFGGAPTDSRKKVPGLVKLGGERKGNQTGKTSRKKKGH